MNGDHLTYGKQRVVIIVVIAVALAGVAWAIGFPMAASGIIVALPVALLNHLLMVRAWKRSQPIDEEQQEADRTISAQMQMQLFGWSFARMLISCAVLLISIRMGTEFVIGMLAGLLCEMVTYIGDTVRMIMVRPGKSR